MDRPGNFPIGSQMKTFKCLICCKTKEDQALSCNVSSNSTNRGLLCVGAVFAEEADADDMKKVFQRNSGKYCWIHHKHAAAAVTRVMDKEGHDFVASMYTFITEEAKPPSKFAIQSYTTRELKKYHSRFGTEREETIACTATSLNQVSNIVSEKEPVRHEVPVTNHSQAPQSNRNSTQLLPSDSNDVPVPPLFPIAVSNQESKNHAAPVSSSSHGNSDMLDNPRPMRRKRKQSFSQTKKEDVYKVNYIRMGKAEVKKKRLVTESSPKKSRKVSSCEPASTVNLDPTPDTVDGGTTDNVSRTKPVMKPCLAADCACCGYFINKYDVPDLNPEPDATSEPSSELTEEKVHEVHRKSRSRRIFI